MGPLGAGFGTYLADDQDVVLGAERGSDHLATYTTAAVWELWRSRLALPAEEAIAPPIRNAENAIP